MPLTQTQAIEQNIVRSLIAYLDTNVVTPYNTAVASGAFPTPLGIQLEWPDDPDKSPAVPLIIIEEPEDVRPQQSTGMGDGIVYKSKQFRMYCFPAVTTDNNPSITAAATLRNYIDFALGTGLYIPLYDYTQAGNPQIEAARVDDSRFIKATKSFAPLLNIEKHRFDFMLTLCYPVIAING